MSGRSLLKYWTVTSTNTTQAGIRMSSSARQTIRHDRQNNQFSIKLDDNPELSNIIASEGTHKLPLLYQVPVQRPRREIYWAKTGALINQNVAESTPEEYIGPKMVDLYSTTVPVQFRGQGVGMQLAQAAMNFVVEEDLKARASCWFVKKFLDENPLPKYKERIVN